MKISHPKVKKIAAQAERRIQKLTGSDNVLLVLMKEPEVNASFDKVVSVVCDVRSVPVELMLSNSRKRRYVITRQLISYYAKISCGMTLVSIAEKFGQDHTTVIHSIRTIKNLLEVDSDLVTKHVKEINRRLEELALAAPAPTNGTANKC